MPTSQANRKTNAMNNQRSQEVQAAIDSLEAMPPFNWEALRGYITQLEARQQAPTGLREDFDCYEWAKRQIETFTQPVEPANPVAEDVEALAEVICNALHTTYFDGPEIVAKHITTFLAQHNPVQAAPVDWTRESAFERTSGDVMRAAKALEAKTEPTLTVIRELVEALESVQSDMRDTCPLGEYVCVEVDTALNRARSFNAGKVE